MNIIKYFKLKEKNLISNDDDDDDYDLRGDDDDGFHDYTECNYYNNCLDYNYYADDNNQLDYNYNYGYIDGVGGDDYHSRRCHN